MPNKFEALLPRRSLLPLLCVAAVHALSWCGTKALGGLLEQHDIGLPLDNMIPFSPPWVLVYVFTFLFWALGLIVMARQEEGLCCRFAAGVIIADIISGVIFLAYPTAISRPEVQVTDAFTWLLSFIYDIDSPTNCFPSLHVLFSYLVFRQSLVCPRAKAWYRTLCASFALLIFASVLLVKQHFVLDVAGGLVLGELSYVLGQRLPLWKALLGLSKNRRAA